MSYSRLVDVVFALPQNYRCSLAVEMIIDHLNSGAQTLGEAVAMVENGNNSISMTNNLSICKISRTKCSEK